MQKKLRKMFLVCAIISLFLTISTMAQDTAAGRGRAGASGDSCAVGRNGRGMRGLRGSTATVFVPAKDSGSVTENGQTVANY